jgi:putative DNA primase/helicase
LQFIAPDGCKVFKTGTNKAGHFFKIGRSKDNTVIICEGYATGASIHQATGHAVVVAFDAGNLSPVAQGIRLKFPDMKIIIAADDDLSWGHHYEVASPRA